MTKHIVAKPFKTPGRKFAPAPRAKAGEPQSHALITPDDIDGPVTFAEWKARGFIVELPRPASKPTDAKTGKGDSPG